MCLSCHQGLSDDVIKQQLTDSLVNPKYEVWNSTSLSHIRISMTGINGKEVQEVATKLYEAYIQWAEEQNPIFGKYGNGFMLTGPPPPISFEKYVLKRFKEELIPLSDKYSKDEIRNQIYHNENVNDVSLAKLFMDIMTEGERLHPQSDFYVEKTNQVVNGCLIF